MRHNAVGALYCLLGFLQKGIQKGKNWPETLSEIEWLPSERKKEIKAEIIFSFEVLTREQFVR